MALGSLSAEDVGTDDYDDKAREELVKELRTKLERMGTVNLMAIEEYDALTERYDFLQSQYDDLTKARQALLDVVARIDATIKEMFPRDLSRRRRELPPVFSGGCSTAARRASICINERRSPRIGHRD